MTTSVGGKVISARIEGKDSSEVSAVIDSIFSKSSIMGDNVNINNYVTTHIEMEQVEDSVVISGNVSQLFKQECIDIASILNMLNEELTTTNQLSSDERKEALDILREVSEQAVASPEERVKKGVLKGALVGLAAAIATSADLTELWNFVYPVLRSHFGL